MSSSETSKVVPQETDIPSILPLLPIQEAVIYPFMRLSSLIVGGELWVKMLDETLLTQKVIALFWYQGAETEELDLLALGKTGTAAQVLGLLRLPGGSLQLHVQGLARIQLEQITQTEPYPLAKIQVCDRQVASSVELEGLARSALGLFQEVVDLAPYLSEELVSAATKVKDPGTLADCIATTIGLKLEEQQQILDILDVTKRLRMILAAQRAGMHTVILPKDNEPDLKEVPSSAREQLQFVLVEHMDEVLPIALYPVGRDNSLVFGSS